jgi:hypothetical protein
MVCNDLRHDRERFALDGQDRMGKNPIPLSMGCSFDATGDEMKKLLLEARKKQPR